MSWYLYGLVEGGAGLPPQLCGIDGAPVRLATIETLEAVISDSPTPTVTASKENILAHARVLDAVIADRTPLPFRFGAIVTPEALDKFIGANLDALTSDLARVRGQVQMTIRLAIRSRPSTAEPDTGEGPGTRFLKERLAVRERLADAADWLTKEMGELAREAESTIVTAPSAIATVAHLVRRANVDEYNSRFEAVCSQRPDFACLRSGPWPPYAFVSTGKKSGSAGL